MKPTPMYMLIPKSDNQKTGRMAVSTSPKQTCPATCPFKENGCYASSGPLALWWKRCSESFDDSEKAWSSFCDQVAALPRGTILRHNQAGDLVPVFPTRNFELDQEKAIELAVACEAAGVKGYTYTHYPVLFGEGGYTQQVIDANRRIIELLNRREFTVNISANSLAHADAIIDSGLRAPVTTLVKSGTIEHNFRTPKGRPVVLCPAMWRKDMTCSKCHGCMSPKRTTIIAFPSHGTCKKRCDAVIAEWDAKYDTF